MADTIADSLNTLFESELFEENNFIKIYNLLGIHGNISTLPEPSVTTPTITTPATAPPVTTPATAQSINIVNIVKINNDLIISGGFYENDIIINDYYSHIRSSQKQLLSNINSNIINDDILKHYEGNIIIDPANLDSINKVNGLTGNSGLSGEIYKLLADNKTYSDNDFIKTIKNHEVLYTDSYSNAFYDEYKTNNNNTIMNIIHTVGPSFRDNITSDDTYDNYIKYLSYKTFNKIYNNIYDKYWVKSTGTRKLLLVPISSGQFATYTYNNVTTNITKEILTITAAIFIKLYLKNQNVYMYIYNNNNNNDTTDYNYFIAQINKIIDLINT